MVPWSKNASSQQMSYRITSIPFILRADNQNEAYRISDISASSCNRILHQNYAAPS